MGTKLKKHIDRYSIITFQFEKAARLLDKRVIKMSSLILQFNQDVFLYRELKTVTDLARTLFASALNSAIIASKLQLLVFPVCHNYKNKQKDLGHHNKNTQPLYNERDKNNAITNVNHPRSNFMF